MCVSYQYFIQTASVNSTEDDSEVEEWWDALTEECRLMQLNTSEAKIRLTAEIAIVIGAFIYLGSAIREARFLGGRMFFENLVRNVIVYPPITIHNLLYANYISNI